MKSLLGLLKSEKNWLVFIMLCIVLMAGLYYRVSFAYIIQYSNLHLGTEFGHDEYNYIVMAKDLIKNNIYGYLSEGGEPNAYVTPVYPLFLAALYLIFGLGDETILYIKIVQAVISTLTILVVYLIGNKVANKYVGLIAAIFVAFYPPLILYSRHLLTETLYIFMYLVYFWVQLHALDKNKKGLHFVSGILIALAILVRPLIFILLPLPYIYKYFNTKDQKIDILKSFTYYILGFIIIMSFWWTRNIIVLNKFILLCTQSNPFYYGIIEDYLSLPKSSNETVDGIKLIINNLINSPIETIKWYTTGKINIIFGYPDYWMPKGQKYLYSLLPIHYFILVCGALGIYVSIYKKEIRLISIFVMLNIAFQLLFIPVPRYAVPLMPLIAICGAYLLWLLYSFLKLAKINVR